MPGFNWGTETQKWTKLKRLPRDSTQAGIIKDPFCLSFCPQLWTGTHRRCGTVPGPSPRRLTSVSGAVIARPSLDSFIYTWYFPRMGPLPPSVGSLKTPLPLTGSWTCKNISMFFGYHRAYHEWGTALSFPDIYLLCPEPTHWVQLLSPSWQCEDTVGHLPETTQLVFLPVYSPSSKIFLFLLPVGSGGDFLPL